MGRFGSELISETSRHFKVLDENFNPRRLAINSLFPSRSSLSSLYRETRRSLAASCELGDAAIVCFTELNFYRILYRGNSWNDCYFGWIPI